MKITLSDVMFAQKVKLKRRRMKLQQAIQERLSKVEKIKLSADLGGEHPKESRVKSKDLIRQLEEEISELQRRNSELEQLSQTDDDLHFVQVCIESTDSSVNEISFFGLLSVFVTLNAAQQTLILWHNLSLVSTEISTRYVILMTNMSTNDLQERRNNV